MDCDTLKKLLEPVKAMSVVAGKAILAVSLDSADVTAKEDGSPLTRADTASHEVIAAELDKLDPAFPVLSEEGDLTVEPGAWDVYWCVDPLDGTKEFVKGLGEYTVNIALVARGKPVLGVIYVPAQDVLYFAAAGLGAWKQSSDGSVDRIAPSGRTAPQTAVVSRSHLSAETEEFLERLNVNDRISHGSSLKICAVAEGSADIYPRHGPTCLWDTAAGTAIATEAGCKVIDLAGEDLRFAPAEGIKQSGFIVYGASVDISAGLD